MKKTAFCLPLIILAFLCVSPAFAQGGSSSPYEYRQNCAPKYYPESQMNATDDGNYWGLKMLENEMRRCPQLYQFDYGSRLFFGYTQGLGAKAVWAAWCATGFQRYYDYVYQWMDTIVGPQGQIHLYDPASYNLDFINSGKMLFDLYAATAEPRFKQAVDTLMDKQMRSQPRTPEGAYWHKKIYVQQQWLDGLYMAGPFLAQYGAFSGDRAWIDEAVRQLLLADAHTYDAGKGLFYHAWDSSHEQAWSDENGHSPNFWGRAIGWYAMALVDILDFVPENHPQRSQVLDVVGRLAEGMARWQDPHSHLWYQVVDAGDREGNYLEASVSAMMMYFYAKAANKGYLPMTYKRMAGRILDGFRAHLIVENEDGTISLKQCCAVGGLGGHPYRDGSFEYYIHERVRDNDGKATGAFILGCLELARVTD